MEFLRKNWKWLAAGAVGIGILAYAARADAADLGGTCCSDLDERIAELEATVARKGNRKLTLKIEGVFNKTFWAGDTDGFSWEKVVENGNDESRLKFSGEAEFTAGWKAGYTVEIGQGKTNFDVDVGNGNIGFVTDNDLYTRQSYVGIANKDLGTITLGLRSMATDDLVQQNVANTAHVAKRLTLQPLAGVTISLFGNTLIEIPLEPFNGTKANAVRYDSPNISGFVASAAWSSDDDSWDVALKYASSKALPGLSVVAAVGYYNDSTNDLIQPLLGPVDFESTTLTVNGGVKHDQTGLFVQGSWSRLEFDNLNVSTDAYHVQAGIERKWFALGASTFYGEYLEWQDLDLTVYGVGFNQNIAEAIDLYATARRHEFGGTDVDTFMAGARVAF